MFHTGGNRIWGKPLGVPFFEGILMVLMASHQKNSDKDVFRGTARAHFLLILRGVTVSRD
jgi:hypothetical protein